MLINRLKGCFSHEKIFQYKGIILLSLFIKLFLRKFPIEKVVDTVKIKVLI